MLLQNIIHCGNAFDLLKEVEEESVDLIVCHGPYGVTKNDWDRIIAIQDFNLDLIRCFTPKLKDGGALYLFGKPDCLEGTSINSKLAVAGGHPPPLVPGNMGIPTMRFMVGSNK